MDTNVLGTLNIMQAARELGLQRVIHTSTSEVYGSAQFVPITEEHPLLGQSPYSASKIGADQSALSYHLSFETPVVVFRPFNTYGPRQSARAVIPTVITQIAGGQSEIKLGSLYPTRDFTFVLDTAAAFVAALRVGGGLGEVVNVGSNFEISIGDTAELIARLMERDVDIISDESRIRPTKSEVDRLWADATKARTLFGWEPDRQGLSGFEHGLRKTIEWFLECEVAERYKPEIFNV